MSTAADVSAGGADLRHRQVHDDSPDAGGGIDPGRTPPMEPPRAAQEGGIGKPKKTFGRTPDGTGE